MPAQQLAGAREADDACTDHRDVHVKGCSADQAEAGAKAQEEGE